MPEGTNVHHAPVSRPALFCAQYKFVFQLTSLTLVSPITLSAVSAPIA